MKMCIRNVLILSAFLIGVPTFAFAASTPCNASISVFASSKSGPGAVNPAHQIQFLGSSCPALPAQCKFSGTAIAYVEPEDRELLAAAMTIWAKNWTAGMWIQTDAPAKDSGLVCKLYMIWRQ